MWLSVERTPGRHALVGGVHKLVREPVLVLVGPRAEGTTVFCDWVITHPGLVPGPYPLENGITVTIPPALCSTEGRAVHTITLEVKHEQNQEKR